MGDAIRALSHVGGAVLIDNLTGGRGLATAGYGDQLARQRRRRPSWLRSAATAMVALHVFPTTAARTRYGTAEHRRPRLRSALPGAPLTFAPLAEQRDRQISGLD
jgi:hypothetical protein